MKFLKFGESLIKFPVIWYIVDLCRANVHYCPLLPLVAVVAGFIILACKVTFTLISSNVPYSDTLLAHQGRLPEMGSEFAYKIVQPKVCQKGLAAL